MSSNDHSVFRFSIYLVVVILINIAAYTMFFRADLTSKGVYSLSDVSKKAVSTLSEPLTINVFFTKNLPAPYNNTEKYISDLLKEYAISGNRYFNYRFYDVSPQEGMVQEEIRKNQELADSFGIQPVQIQALDKDEVKFKMAYMGVVLIHGDMIERIPAVTSPDRLEYQLTTAIQRLNNKIGAFLRLSEKIKLKFFLSSSLMEVAPLMGIEDLQGLSRELDQAVEELNRKNYNKLDYIKFDPSTDDSLDEEVRKYDILTLNWPDVPDRSIRAGKGSIGMIAEYNDRVLEIPLLEILNIPVLGTQQVKTIYSLVDMEVVKEVISKSVESLVDINENLGYLADHGCVSLWGRGMNIPGMPAEESISKFNNVVSKNYSIKEVRLSDRDILDGLNCLIIASPKEQFTDYELFRIDQYLMKGKSLALFLDSFEEVSGPGGRSGGFMPSETGLDKLLSHYGVNINKSLVMDKNCYVARMPREYGGGEQPLYYVAEIKDEFINKELPFIKDIRGLLVQQSSPVILNEDVINKSGLKSHKLFSSSGDSWEMNPPINLNPLMLQPPGPYVELKSYPLAYLVEGEFTSYFADKPVPRAEIQEEKEEDKKDEKEKESSLPETFENISAGDKKITKGRPGKIFIIGTSGVLKDNVIDLEGEQSNSVFIMNLLDYLNDREDIAVMRSKAGNLNPLEDLSAGSKAVIKYFNIIGLPAIVVLFGLVIWFCRHRRKLAIQAMFGK